jgi:hypothetical protein
MSEKQPVSQRALNTDDEDGVSLVAKGEESALTR